MYVTRPNPQKREIFLWKKANISGIEEQHGNELDTFNRTDFSDVNSMWAYIKDTIQSTIKKHVPTRRTLAKHTHPWMNSDLRRLSNKKQRAYTQAKRSGATKDWRRYKSLKAELQRESRRAHSAYMEDIVSEDLQKNPKRFWSYVKSRKQDSSQIVTLKSKDGYMYLHSDTASKASILNQQFQSVYTREDLSTLPDHPPMNNIVVHERGVLKLLKGLRPFKVKSRKYQGVFEVKKRVKTWQVRGIWSQQLEH